MKVLYLLYSNIKVYPGNTRRIRTKKQKQKSDIDKRTNLLDNFQQQQKKFFHYAFKSIIGE